MDNKDIIRLKEALAYSARLMDEAHEEHASKGDEERFATYLDGYAGGLREALAIVEEIFGK